jgi:hypothetical protein
VIPGKKTYNTMILLYYFRAEVLGDRDGEGKENNMLRKCAAY